MMHTGLNMLCLVAYYLGSCNAMDTDLWLHLPTARINVIWTTNNAPVITKGRSLTGLLGTYLRQARPALSSPCSQLWKAMDIMDMALRWYSNNPTTAFDDCPLW